MSIKAIPAFAFPYPDTPLAEKQLGKNASPSIEGIVSNAQKSNSEASVISLSQNEFRFRLEKHIIDHETGQGHLSRPMYKDLSDKYQASRGAMSEDPEALALYSGYMTAGFAYDKQARFVTAMNQVAKTVDTINSATEEEEK